MTQWRYYFSGICGGIFEAAPGEVRFRWLRPELGKMGSLRLLDTPSLDELKEKNKLDFSVLTRLDRITADFAGDRERVETEYGLYHRREAGHYVQVDRQFPTDILFRQGEPALFVCPGRGNTEFLVREDQEDDPLLKQWQALDQGREPGVVAPPRTFLVKTRDGIDLATDVYLPEGQTGPAPTILVRTCYSKTRGQESYYPFVQRGYALVIQDVRGRDQSGGTFIPGCAETEDGDDTLNWIAVQPWSNGKIGMIGASYLGMVQWAAAASGNPHLSALVSIVTSGGAFVDIPRRGGAFVSAMIPWAFAMAERELNQKNMIRDDWDAVMNIRPLEAMARQAMGRDIPFVSEWLKHPDYDAFWRQSDWRSRASDRQVPALIVSGWFDDDGMGTTEALDLTAKYPREYRKVILGPWSHSANTRYTLNGFFMGTRALRYDLDLLYHRWFDRHLRGINQGTDTEAVVEYFTLTENRWKTSDTWPLPSCRELPLYLAGEGLAPQAGEPGERSYIYDPANPALHIIDMSENDGALPADYTDEEKRPDILSYTTAPLEQGLVITGDLRVELYISSDAPDTDFVVRLTALEGGRSIRMADGVLSAKYREGFEHPRYLEPGTVYPLVIRTTKFSKFFPQGTQIRLTITSGAKNFIFPNSNTPEGFAGLHVVRARNTIHHGKTYPSRVLLPIETGADFLPN
ncbi:MAG: CocE/NonD family hydrolase [Spirochaetaceae bacterium]|jgi:putative CocE/NonD family hydrolase|nr:CocE/NonD family hydrolase [Spirochaetaceae bacterium]